MVFFICIQLLIDILQANSGEPDQTPRFAASDLVFHCLSMSFKKDAMLIRVNIEYQSMYKNGFLLIFK